jgi:undecaprenyl-diphosphatase
MSILESIILGIVQGLTEFLPVSSSGHIELGKAILNVHTADNLLFSIVVHGATALSTIIVFRKVIIDLIRGLMEFKDNEALRYAIKIFISMVPVGIVGVLFEEKIEALFTGDVLLVGAMLFITGLLLTFTYYANNFKKDITYDRAIIIGLAQAIAILPGLSRSGLTISTALLLGVKKEKATKFSFLMVLIPIFGAIIFKLKIFIDSPELFVGISPIVLLVGFLASFISGLAACTWMVNIVKKGKLIYFAYYCFAVGIISIAISFL